MYCAQWTAHNTGQMANCTLCTHCTLYVHTVHSMYTLHPCRIGIGSHPEKMTPVYRVAEVMEVCETAKVYDVMKVAEHLYKM